MMQTKAIRYYFNKLRPPHQRIYEELLNGFINHKSEISIRGCSQDELLTIRNFLLLDNPLLFHVGNRSMISSNGGTSNTFLHDLANVFLPSSVASLLNGFGNTTDTDEIVFCPSYDYSPQVTRDIQRQIHDKVNSVLRSIILPNDDNLAKERAVYAYIAQNTRYSSSNRHEPENHSMVGPLLNRSAVCEGYAKALKHLCDIIGIPNLEVGGKAIAPHGDWEPHAWNIIKVNGICFQADVTWDSTDGGDIYTYFNVSDDVMKRDHEWNRRLVPPCGMDLFPVPCVHSLKELERFVLSHAAKGKRQLQVRFSKKFESSRVILDMVGRILYKAPTRVTRTINSIGVNYNERQNQAVIELKQ